VAARREEGQRVVAGRLVSPAAAADEDRRVDLSIRRRERRDRWRAVAALFVRVLSAEEDERLVCLLAWFRVSRGHFTCLEVVVMMMERKTKRKEVLRRNSLSRV